jgi:hypothetical protein
LPQKKKTKKKNPSTLGCEQVLLIKKIGEISQEGKAI